MSDIGNVSPIRQRHLWEQIAEELRATILSGNLTPGTRLITADLADRWGVSRGPVREALMALENEGIVVSTRRHGTVVGSTSIVDLGEVLRVREAIETFAAADACALGDELPQADLRALSDLLKEVELAQRRGEYEAARQLDLDFHQAVVDLAGNSRFSRIYRHMLSQSRHHARAIDSSGLSIAGFSDVYASNESIFNGLLAGDETSVSQAIAAHYRHARQSAARTPSMPQGAPGSSELRGGLGSIGAAAR